MIDVGHYWDGAAIEQKDCFYICHGVSFPMMPGCGDCIVTVLDLLGGEIIG